MWRRTGSKTKSIVLMLFANTFTLILSGLREEEKREDERVEREQRELERK